MVPNLNINSLVIGFCSCMGLVIRRAVVWQSKNFEKMIKMETMAIKMFNNVMVRFYTLTKFWIYCITLTNIITYFRFEESIYYFIINKMSKRQNITKLSANYPLSLA